ncbi:ABC transporter permease [Gordonia sp. (in: high G+C Gram-positive bacteria)]|uniref:ABC transporter permease n=1 Tax=Gordonia sp. (in: high G+C Gram-positive bacteria) TaxID=84139 RepID=UPI0016B1F3D1|nr:ABC transporter permease [Gordonia sp. (in: high G+C Gram-positive bacteria)]NLG46581.1 ABC transporter permease [Gordonia sp. (in: high G+C Gram-positive bacteria)]
MTGFAQLLRAVRAEGVRLGGRRGPLAFAALPGAVLAPLIVTFVIAAVAERFATMSASIQVTSVQTSNAVYWVLTFTVITWALIAATAQASIARGSAGDLERYLFPRSWTAPAARWLLCGTSSAAMGLVLVIVVMTVLPAAFPAVYGGVDIGSPEGLRFLATVPVYAFVTCGIGVGLGALIGHPVVTAVVLLGWAFVVENSIALAPNGYTMQGYMPFLNGQFGTGQDLAFTPPWGMNGALAYSAGVAVVLFAAGCAVLARRRS